MRRFWGALAASLAGLAGLAGMVLVIYRYEATHADRYLAAARRALADGNRHEADRLTNLLEQEGATDYVHLIRGEVSLREARLLRKELDDLGKWLQAERATRLTRDAVAQLCQPIVGREGRLLESAYLAHLDIGSSPARRRLALDNESRALLREALREFHSISKHDPLVLEAAGPSGECFLRLKELGVQVPVREAIKRLQVAVDREPDNLQARRWLATLYLDIKAPHEAVGELVEVAKLAPEDGRPHRTMGYVYKLYHQYERAKNAYDEALKRHLEPHVVAEVISESAEVLIDTGHPTEALERIAQCPASFADDPYLLSLKGECLWHLGHVEEASNLVDRALREDSNLMPALRLRASIYLAQDQPENALPLLLRFVRMDPINNQARKLLADTYRFLGEQVKADEQMKLRDRLYDFNQQLMKLNTELMDNPQDDELRYQIGALWLSINQLIDARIWLRSALEINPNNARAKHALERLEPPVSTPIGR